MSARVKRDEFSCPCCGTPTDGSFCGPCDAADCGSESVYDASDICVASLLAKGWRSLGDCYERVQLRGGAIELCRVELWHKPDGERSFGRVLEVLS